MDISAFKDALKQHHLVPRLPALDTDVLILLRTESRPDESPIRKEMDTEFIKLFTQRAMYILEEQHPRDYHGLLWAASRYCKRGCTALDDEPERDIGLAHLLSRQARFLSFIDNDSHCPTSYNRLDLMFKLSTSAIRQRWHARNTHPRKLREFMTVEHRTRADTAWRLYQRSGKLAWAWRAAEDYQTSAGFEPGNPARQRAQAAVAYMTVGDILARRNEDASEPYARAREMQPPLEVARHA